jgi:hypothetical protein
MFGGFREIVDIDFEFESAAGERPVPVCCVARELGSRRVFRIFQGEFGKSPPFATGDDVLTIAYYASAELGCYRVLGWEMPRRTIDLFAEFRVRTNGLPLPAGAGLTGALAYFGLDHATVDKREMQKAIGAGAWRGQYSQQAILDYCESDTDALERLFNVMAPEIDLPRALLRGRYMAAAAAMEYAGVPIDRPTLELLRERWTGIQDLLIAEIDKDYGVFDGRTFKADRFTQWLAAQNIPWLRLENGALDLSDKCFRSMAKAFPRVSPLRELRSSLSELRLNDLQVGKDARNRVMLSAFRARTSRNQPSNSKFIFGPSVWIRGLIKPAPGHAVFYADYSQQEFGAAAALSGDLAMQTAYASQDPYLAFAIQSGLAPADATKKSHGAIRELAKACILGTQYGMQEQSLAQRIGQPVVMARDLLRLHRETYRVFWRWSDAALDCAMLTGKLHTVFGWRIHVDAGTNPRSLRNFPMQANGAEMLRLACCLATERGVEVAAPIHDAVLVSSPLERLEMDIATTRAAMIEASRIVLGGFELRVDASVTKWPDRFMDARGLTMWNRVIGLIGREDCGRLTA